MTLHRKNVMRNIRDAHEWAARYDRANDYTTQVAADLMAEEIWAKSLGFDSAQDYWDATLEAFETEQLNMDEWLS